MKKLLTFLVLCLVLLSSLEAADQSSSPRLLIKIPTRQRPQKFFEVLNLYYEKISKKIPYEFVISCDVDDHLMNNSDVRAKLKKYPNLHVHFGNNTSKVQACNADLEKYTDFDILLLASDDMYPMIQDYDLLIAQMMQAYFPDYDGIIHFDDGNPLANGVMNYPIMGKKFYDRLGYIYHPDYKSFYCNTELTMVGYMLNKTARINLVVLEHRHPYYLKAKTDPLYQRNDQYWKRDEVQFYKRMADNFGLEASEIVTPIQ